MSLPSELSKYKAPGVKIMTEVVESTPTASAPAGARVLIVNSRKGPVNAMTLVSSFSEYESIFDSISDADERRGNYGAVNAEQMLLVSPIYVLNLRQFDNELDKAGVQEISMETSVSNKVSSLLPYQSLYNTQQMWKIDPSKLLKQSNLDNLLVFANIGSSSLSIFVRKTKTVQKQLTFEQWYSNLSRPMPSYVNPSDKIQDWTVDVMVFSNQFTSASSSNSSYGYCFNNDGSVKTSVVNTSNQTVDGLTQLSKISESGFLLTMTGSLIQGFKDEFGNNFDIVQTINSSIQKIGLVAKLNDKLFDSAGIWQAEETAISNGLKKPVPVDFLGHSLCNITEVGTFDEDAYAAVSNVTCASYAYDISVDTYDVANTQFVSSSKLASSASAIKTLAMLPGLKNGLNVEIVSTNQLYVTEENKPSLSDSYVGYDGNLASVKSVSLVGNHKKIYNYGTKKLPVQPFGDDVAFPLSHSWENAQGTDTTFIYADAGKVFPKDATNTYFVYPSTHILAGKALAFDQATGLVVHNPTAAGIDSDLYVYQQTVSGTIIPTDLTDIVGYTPSVNAQLIELSDISATRLIASDEENTTTLYSTMVTANSISENVYLVTFNKPLAINSLSQTDTVDISPIVFDSELHTIKLTSGSEVTIYNNGLYVFNIKSSDTMSTKFMPMNLKSYTPRTAQFLNGTADRQTEVLNTLLGTGLRNALQNQDLVQWTYIVDGFKSYIEPNCKYQLKTIAEDRILGRAIYNMPSIYDFSASTNPYFKATEDGDFEPKYIALGGNYELPYSNGFSLPSENGFYAYGFGPNFLMSSGKSIPIAGIVSNSFAKKYINNKPYAILAGTGDGLIIGTGIVNVEHVFNEKNDGTGDRDYLDPFGYNVVLKKASGLQIYGNRTSQNSVETAMSSIHTSEIVMFIQSRVKSLLERFVFKYNTAQNRLVIKEEADSICNEPLGDGAISGYINQMNDINNNAEIVKNRFGILDTTIYANNGMEVLVHRTKIDTVSNTATFEIL